MSRALLALSFVALTLLAVPAAAATSADQQLARAGVLRLSDFPAGWTQHAPDTKSDAMVGAQAAKIPSCKPFATFMSANRRNPRALSRDFELAQSSVTNTVSVYPTTAKAQAAIATFRDRRIPNCLDLLFTRVFKDEFAKDKKTAKQLKTVTTDIARDDGVRLGDDAVFYQGTVDVSLKNGTRQAIALGFVTVRIGTALTGYSYSTVADISAALQPAIVASVSRLQRASPPG